MLYDKGLATQKIKDDILAIEEYRARGGGGCISSRICEKCNHLISDSICLCLPYFVCPNCGFENGVRIKEGIKNIREFRSSFIKLSFPIGYPWYLPDDGVFEKDVIEDYSI